MQRFISKFYTRAGWVYEDVDDLYSYVKKVEQIDGRRWYCYFYCNIDSDEISAEGQFEIDISGIHICFLEDEFGDPLNPTDEECTLFELTHGISYPII